MGGLPVLATEMSLAEGLRHHGLDAPDVAIDSAGQEQPCATNAWRCWRIAACMVSVAHGEGLTIKDLYRDFVFREMTLIGSEYFAYNELERNLTLLQANRAYLNQIITHRLGVDEIQHAFELFFAGQTGKVIIEQ